MSALDTVVDPVATGTDSATMMALVYDGPGQRSWQSKPPADRARSR